MQKEMIYIRRYSRVESVKEIGQITRTNSLLISNEFVCG